MLVEKVLRVSRAWIITHDTDPIALADWQLLLALAKRRLAGEPMAYIVGEREFMGLMFKVSPAVLIPRPDTETLVEQALIFLKNEGITPFAKVLDLGTGSGAIAIALAHYANCQVWAGDISQEALQVAQINAQLLGARVECRQSSWFDAFCGMRFNLIVTNPPYIHKDDEHLQQGDLRFEPLLALTDFDDGLCAYRHIIAQAPNYLCKGGAIMLEHGWNQSVSVQALLQKEGFSNIHSVRDLAGIERVSIGYWLT